MSLEWTSDTDLPVEETVDDTTEVVIRKTDGTFTKMSKSNFVKAIPKDNVTDLAADINKIKTPFTYFIENVSGTYSSTKSDGTAISSGTDPSI